MRLRLFVAGSVLLALLFLSFWTTVFFQVNRALKQSVVALEKNGLEIVMLGSKTRGFPFFVEKHIEQIVVRSKEGKKLFFVEASPVVFSSSLFSPSKITCNFGEMKCSYAKLQHYNASKGQALFSLDKAHTACNDLLSFENVVVKSGGKVIADAALAQFERGKKRRSLFAGCTLHNLVVYDGESKELASELSCKLFIESPFRTWEKLSRKVTSETELFKKELQKAVAAASLSVPLLEDFATDLEEQQSALHLTIKLGQGEEMIELLSDLGVVDAMPSGRVAVTGKGSYFEKIATYFKKITANELRSGDEIQLKKAGLFLRNEPLFSFEPISWETFPLATEYFVCDLLSLYGHGEYRKIHAEQNQQTNERESQFSIAEGYYLDGKFEDALQWYKRSGLQQHPEGLLRVAYHYFSGRGCGADHRLARELTEDAVCQGVVLSEQLAIIGDPLFTQWASEMVGMEVVAEK